MTLEQPDLEMSPEEIKEAGRALQARNEIQVIIAKNHSTSELPAGELLQKISPGAHKIFKDNPELLVRYHEDKKGVVAEVEKLLGF